MTDIVIKKANGTTDVTYLHKAVASGTSPAVYRNEAASVIRAMQPTVLVSIASGKTQGTKVANINGGYPGTDGVDLTIAVGKTSLKLQMFTSENVASADTAEGVHQLLNLVASPAVKQQIIDGFAARS